MDYVKNKKIVILRKYLIDGVYILVGCIIMAIGTALFLLPNQLSSGGFSGISTIIYYFLHFPLGTTMLALNIPFLVWALFKLGKEIVI